MENMEEYVGNMQKYVEICEKYEEICGNYEVIWSGGADQHVLRSSEGSKT